MDLLEEDGAHLEQFLPLLVEAFGNVWWRQGGLSLHYVSQSVVGEPVRCYLQRLGPRRARVWMNTEGEALVLQGTAGLGDDPDSEVRSRISPFQPAALQVLSQVTVGEVTDVLPVRITAADADARLPFVAEPLRCYHDPAPFDGRVVPPSLAVHAMRRVEERLIPGLDRLAVSGGMEFRNVSGPVYCDTDYRLQGRVLGLSASREREKLSYQADLYDLRDTLVASLIRMLHIHVADLPAR